MVAPIRVRVPPEQYGGIELVISLLTEELVKRGVDVTLYASGDAVTKAPLRYVYPKAIGFGMPHESFMLTHMAFAYGEVNQYDIVHNHAGVAGIAMARLIETPVLTTLHNNYFISENKAFFEENKNNQFYNAISESQKKSIPGLNYIKTVYNAIDPSQYPVTSEKEDYLLSLGNICEVKGHDIAIQVARRLKMKLVIAGKLDPGGIDFFNQKIKPEIDNKLVFFEGQVSQERKLELFARARAFLFPVRWEEPFGLVMVEAMACGTPVIGFRRGSVPEVVKDGETGFVVDTPEEMAAAVERAGEILPQRCREHVEERFSPRKMTDDYVSVYEEIGEITFDGKAPKPEKAGI